MDSPDDRSHLVSDEEFMTYQDTEALKSGFVSKTTYGSVNSSAVSTEENVMFVYRPNENKNENDDNVSISNFETDEDILSDIFEQDSDSQEESDNEHIVAVEERNNEHMIPMKQDLDSDKEQALKLSEKFLLLILCIDKFVNQCTRYFLMPFLPVFALQKEVTPLVISIVFASIAVAGFLVTVPLKNLLTRCRIKRMMTLSFACHSLAVLLLCVTYYIGPGWFPLSIAVLRFIDGIAVTIFQTASLTLCYMVFPVSYFGHVMAYMEVAALLGFCAAPILGGSLYYVGGFTLPFLVFGGVLCIILFPANVIVIPNDHTYDNMKCSEVKPIKKPAMNVEFIILSVLFGVVVFTISYFQPIIAFHLNEMGSNALQIGGIIAIFPVCFGVGTVIFGFLSDKYSFSNPCIIVIGLFTQFIGAMFMGPNIGLWFVNSSPLQISLCLSVYGFGCGILPAISNTMAISVTYGDDSLSESVARNTVSFFTAAYYYIGFTIGPICAGTMYQYVTFAWAMTLPALLCVTTAFVYIPFLIYKRCKK